ncbi:hypothetical protein DRQ36_03185 [bacterium]|nr:MAG: hypothetical protein DRQ36_03185 [bacterium]
MNENYVKKLEAVIAKMLEPVKDVPFNIIIKSLSGCDVIPFNKRSKKDRELLSTLKKVADIAGKDINNNPILRLRANEVGNDIEEYVKRALLDIGYRAEIPTCRSGKRKSTGYPDIIFYDKFDRPNYLECKTYSEESRFTTFRSFYFSPSDDFKVTLDAHHLVVSYKIYVAGRSRNKNIYKTKGWKILSIENLLCDVKHEFNSDNLRLYSEELVLAEGSL